MNSQRRRKTRWLIFVPAVGGLMLIALPVVLLGGVSSPQCTPLSAPSTFPTGSGPWIATAYGPPWNVMNGSGITATGLNLTAGQPAYEIAVDPAVVPLQSFEHVTPNPFATSHAFYAGDTGGAIIGRHVDIYDWLGRSAQDAWGVRHVNVTPAPNPGTGNLLGEITPAPTGTGATPNAQSGAAWTPTCDGLAGTATLKLVPGQQARILPDGTAAAPQDAPAAVKVAIAAANEIHTKPYPVPDVHYGSLAQPWPAYDCSATVSYVLYRAGLHAVWPDDSTGLESWGLRGPGRWITVYADSGHTWIVIAGLAFDTADYGGPNIPPGSGPRWRQSPLGNLADGRSLHHPTPARPMTLADTARRHPAHARVRRSWARTALVVLAAGALGGCAGITNPYQSTGTTRTPTAASTSTTTAPADSGDPAPERGGTIPSSARAAQTKLAIGAASRSPEAALERYAELYVNWTAANVAARQRELAAISVGQARAQALQAAASAAHDTQLLKSRVADGGTVVAITRGRGPAAGDWVLVAREQTTGQGDYAGLPPTLHVIYAQLAHTANGWIVTGWQAEN